MSKKQFVLDRHLRQYATDRQWELLKAIEDHGSERKAAKAIGCARSLLHQAKRAVMKRAALQGYAPDYDLVHEIPEGLTSRGASTKYDDEGKIIEQWVKSRVAGMEPEESFQLPDPKTVTKVSKATDGTGKVIMQWITEKPELVAQNKAWQEAAAELAAALPRIEATPAPMTAISHLMSCYPVGDLHLGMLAWAIETGADWDLSIAEKMFADCFTYLIQTAPDSDEAAIVLLGDFLHYDSFKPLTPTSGNLLDADSRFPKMVRAAIRCIKRMVETALKKHKRVRLVIEIGNHDLSSSIFLMECFANMYADEPRLTVDTSPRHFHYFQFGKNLVGTHHGHGPKIQDLPLIMACDVPEMWGSTENRYIWTGHVHHDQVKDFRGCKVESMRVIGPEDAHAHQKGYRSMRDMKSIILHTEYGEVDRHTVNPKMFETADVKRVIEETLKFRTGK